MSEHLVQNCFSISYLFGLSYSTAVPRFAPVYVPWGPAMVLSRPLLRADYDPNQFNGPMLS